MNNINLDRSKYPIQSGSASPPPKKTKLNPEFSKDLEKVSLVFDHFSKTKLTKLGEGQQTTWYKLDPETNQIVNHHYNPQGAEEVTVNEFAIGLENDTSKKTDKIVQESINTYLAPIFLLNKRIEVGLSSDKENQKNAAQYLTKHKVQPYIAFQVIDKAKVPIGLVSEVMNVGSMDQLFNEKGFKDEKNVFVFYLSKGLSEICHEIESLHELDLIHGDIAARNILVTKVDDRYVFKLTDFGLIGDVKDKDTIDQTKKMFPVYWSSPEASEGRSSKQSDIWSIGMTILEEYCTINQLDFIDIVTSHLKFDFTEKNLREVYKINLTDSPIDESGHVVYVKELLDKLNVGNRVRNILLKIFKKDPEKRASLREIANDLERLEIVDYIHSKTDTDKFKESTVAHTKEQLKTDLNSKLPNFKEFWKPILEYNQEILDIVEDFNNNKDSFPATRDSSTYTIENALAMMNNLIELTFTSQTDKDKYRNVIRNTYPFIINFTDDNIEINLDKNNELKSEFNLQTITTENKAKYILDNMQYLQEALGKMIVSQPQSPPNKKLVGSKDLYNEPNVI